MIPASAERLGRYHFIAELGHGGMARVHLAVARGPAGFTKLVVLKQLRADLSLDAEFVAMFLDEARLAARLNHPNVVQTNEVGQEGDVCFMALEFMEGQPLNRVIRAASHEGGLPFAHALRIVADVCAGLHYAHELREFDGTPLGVVHRDVSPHNVFVTYDGTVKLMDFGIAKATRRSVQTSAGQMKGKIGYMPPEQASGFEIDRRADVYSLGVVLFEMVTGRRMWRTQDVDVLRELIAGRIPWSPRAVNPDVPEEIDRVCRRALAVAPGDRYATALEMQHDVELCMEALGPRAAPAALGEIVSRLFAEDRADMTAVIERRMRALDASAASPEGAVVESIPTITFGHEGLTPSRSRTGLPKREAKAPRRVYLLAIAAATAGVVGASIALLASRRMFATPSPPPVSGAPRSAVVTASAVASSPGVAASPSMSADTLEAGSARVASASIEAGAAAAPMQPPARRTAPVARPPSPPAGVDPLGDRN